MYLALLMVVLVAMMLSVRSTVDCGPKPISTGPPR